MTKKSNLKKALIAPAILAAGFTIGSNVLTTAHAEDDSNIYTSQVDQSTTQNIETKTVYYSGAKEDSFDENNQDLLVSNSHYKSESGVDKGVSAVVLADKKEKDTSELFSEKALLNVDNAQLLEQAEKDKKAEEYKKAEEEAQKKKEEEERAARASRASNNSSSRSSNNSTPTTTNYSESAPAGAGINGETDFEPNYGAVHSYPVGQCTWGAKALAPWAGDYWGNGGDWAASARAAGYRVGSEPMVGAIASWNNGGYGHVAVVTGVSNGMIKVKEANYNGQWIGYHRGWFNPHTTSEGFVQFIYPPGT